MTILAKAEILLASSTIIAFVVTIFKMQDILSFGKLALHLNQTDESCFHNSLDCNLSSGYRKLIASASSYKLLTYYLCLLTTWLSCLLFSLVKKARVLSLIRISTEVLLLNSTLIVCFPIIIIVNGSLSLIRHCIRVYFKHSSNGQFLLMKSGDAVWAQEDYAQCCNFNCVYVLEGFCDLEKIRQKFQKLTENPKYERMRRNVVRKFGFFCWERNENVCINEHVKLMQDGAEPLTDEQVFQKISEFTDEVFPQDKPPWEVLVVPRYQYTSKFPEESLPRNKRYYALVFRVHHALMDGISAGQVIRNEIADGHVNLSVDPCQPIRISFRQKLYLYTKFSVTSVRNIIKSLLLMESNCFHTGKPLTGPKTYGWSRKIDLNSLKELRIRAGVTTTGTLLTAFGLALKNFAASKKLALPEKIHAGSTVAMLPYPDSKPQNGFILAHLPIYIGHQSKLQNLKQIQQTTRNLSTSSDLIMNKLLLWLVGRWPIGVQDLFLKLVHGTALVSNVPGFKSECTLFGDKLVDAVGWTPLKGTTGMRSA